MDKEIVKTTEIHISCEGREVPYDHPRIYLEIKPELGKIECPYCSKEFIWQQEK